MAILEDIKTEGVNNNTEEVETETPDQEVLYGDGDKKAEVDNINNIEGDKSQEAKSDTDKKEDETLEEDKSKDKPAELLKAEDIKLAGDAPVIPEIMDKFMAFANENKLTSAQAQGLVDLQQEMNEMQAVAQKEALQTQIANWEKEVAVDKEIIGDTGDKMDESMAIANKGMEALKVEGLGEFLDDTGFGSHPLMVKAFYRIGVSISPDTLRLGFAPVDTEPKSTKEVLYGG